MLSLQPILRLYNTAGAARSSVFISYLYTSKEPIIVRQYSLLATILNLKNNPIPILNLQRQLILGEFNLLALALTPKEVDTNNILSFINYITIDKQVKGLLPIKIKI